MDMHFTIPASRALIEDQIEALIALLDAIDGNSDLEEDNEDCCPAHDDEGGAAWLDCYSDGHPGDTNDAEDSDWDLGIEDEPHDQEHELVPAYGIDQTDFCLGEIVSLAEALS